MTVEFVIDLRERNNQSEEEKYLSDLCFFVNTEEYRNFCEIKKKNTLPVIKYKDFTV